MKRRRNSSPPFLPNPTSTLLLDTKVDASLNNVNNNNDYNDYNNNINTSFKKQSTGFKIVPVPGGFKNEKLNVPDRIVPEIPPGSFELHTVIAFLGAKRSGKTNVACLLAKKYQEFGSFTRIFVISPTFEAQPEFKVLDIKDEDVYENADKSIEAITDIERKIKEESLSYKEFLKYKIAYDRWKAGNPKFKDIIELEKKDYEEPDPKRKRPSSLLILDDLSHNKIYLPSTKNPFINLVLRHRHVGGKGYGCSIFMMAQTFKSGIPRVLRQGGVSQFIIFPSKDKTNIREMYEEFGSACTMEDFIAMYDLATKEVHHFLLVDAYNPDPAKRFRQDFDHYLCPAGLEVKPEDIEGENKEKKRKRKKLEKAEVKEMVD